MQLLVPAACAALIGAAALSATAAVPAQRPALPSAAQAHGTTTFAGADTPAATTTAVAPRRGFVWPLSPRPTVVRRFEQPLHQWSPGHRGVDLLAAVGQPVLSAGEGVVAFSGVIAGRGVITVRHAGGLRTTYQPVDQRLPTGTVVHRGTPIGVVSPAPGHCVPQACLHWGAVEGQTYRDPLSLLGFDRPILLPLG